MATTNLASAGPAAGIATTGVANGALVASGAAKVADLTPVSELDQSGTAITDRRRPICSVARTPQQPPPERELSESFQCSSQRRATATATPSPSASSATNAGSNRDIGSAR